MQTAAESPAASPLSLQLTADDFAAAQRLHCQWTRRTWIIMGIVYAPLLCFGAIASAGWPIDSVRPLGHITLGWVVAIMLFNLASNRWLLPWRARRRFASQKLSHGPLSIGWNEAHLSMRSDYGQSVIPWDKFYRHKQNDEYMLLYISQVQFFVIRKAAFSDPATLQAFCDLVARRVPLKPSRR